MINVVAGKEVSMISLDSLVGVGTIVLTLICCTWKLCEKMSSFVTKEECRRFRDGECKYSSRRKSHED